jgi:large subunit ribosomal protein L15
VSAIRGTTLAAAPRAPRAVVAMAVVADGDRLRLSNLAPAPGSRRPNKRKGRGHAAGQV